jgi:pimeloyl-ACP methyl ester carboxylesterase
MQALQSMPMLFGGQSAQTPPDRAGYARSFDGLDIHYEIRGDGPPLVIASSFLMEARHWERFTRRIRRHHAVVTYDLRHQGRSGRTDGPIVPADHVRDLGCLVDHLGLDRFSLLGICASTLACRDYALGAPDRIDRLILVGPLFGPFGSLYRAFFHRSLLASLDAGGPEAVFDHCYPLLHTSRTIENNGTAGYLALKIRFVDENPEDQLRRHLSSMLTVEERPETLKRLRPPTWLLCGEDDFLMSRNALEMLCRLIPDGSYELVGMAGHNPHVEATAEFEGRVVSFLRGEGTARGVAGGR